MCSKAVPSSCFSTFSVPYAALVSTFEKIEATTKRLEILQILTQFFLVVAKRDTKCEAKDSNLLKVVYLCINRVRPLPLCRKDMKLTSNLQAVSRLRWTGTGDRRVIVGKSDCREYRTGYDEDQRGFAEGRRFGQGCYGMY